MASCSISDTPVQPKKKWIAALLGNILEHYDSSIYAFLAPFIAPLFFANDEPIIALIKAYAILPFSSISKPLGALFFGYIGDTKGREAALRLSIFGMTIVTILMGMLPTAASIGSLAPVLLALCRALQGFFTAGENTGGAIYLLEHADSKLHNTMSSVYGSSTILGILLASGMVAGFGYFDLNWRYLFFFGALTGFTGFLFRSSGDKQATQKAQTPSSNRMKQQLKGLWGHKKALISVMLASGFSYASYTISLVLINSVVPLLTSYSTAEMMTVNTFLLGLDMLLLPLVGKAVEKYAAERVMITAGLLTLILGIPLVMALPGASLWTILAVRTLLVFLGVLFCAPFYAWALSQAPPNCRYMVLSLGYTLGAQVIGTPTASFSLWCYNTTQQLWTLPLYWMGLGLCTVTFLIYQRLPEKTVPLRSSV